MAFEGVKVVCVGTAAAAAEVVLPLNNVGVVFVAKVYYVVVIPVSPENRDLIVDPDLTNLTMTPTIAIQRKSMSGILVGSERSQMKQCHVSGDGIVEVEERDILVELCS